MLRSSKRQLTNIAPQFLGRHAKQHTGKALMPVWGDRLGDAVKAVTTFRMW
jgi:hypothetical protein